MRWKAKDEPTALTKEQFITHIISSALQIWLEKWCKASVIRVAARYGVLEENDLRAQYLDQALHRKADREITAICS
jgi:hypothetical protein